MKQVTRSRTFESSASFVLLLYVILSLFVPFFHNHDADFHFHDDCPACQWLVTAQKQDNCIDTVLSSLLNGWMLSGAVSIDLPAKPFIFHCPSNRSTRAPPSIPA